MTKTEQTESGIPKIGDKASTRHGPEGREYYAYGVESKREVQEDRMFLRRPVDKIFTTNKPWGQAFFIQEGQAGVRLRFGERLEMLKMNVGGLVRPGLRYILGWGGLVSSMAIADITSRTEDLIAKDVTTQGGLVLPEVDSILTWRLVDPVLGFTKATTKRDPVYNRIGYAHTTLETALARIRGYFSGRTFAELNSGVVQETNLAYLTQEEIEGQKEKGDKTKMIGGIKFKDGTLLKDIVESQDEKQLIDRKIDYDRDQFGTIRIRYRPEVLRRIGTVLEELYINRVVPEPKLAEAIAEEETAAARQRASQYDKDAAANYADPNARFAAALRVMSQLATGPNNTSYALPPGINEVLEAVRTGIKTS